MLYEIWVRRVIVGRRRGVFFLRFTPTAGAEIFVASLSLSAGLPLPFPSLLLFLSLSAVRMKSQISRRKSVENFMHAFIHITVLLGYCDSWYCDKLFIVTVFRPKWQCYTVKASIIVTLAYCDKFLSGSNSATITEKDCIVFCLPRLIGLTRSSTASTLIVNQTRRDDRPHGGTTTKQGPNFTRTNIAFNEMKCRDSGRFNDRTVGRQTSG